MVNRMRADVCFSFGNKQCYAPQYKSGDGLGPYGCAERDENKPLTADARVQQPSRAAEFGFHDMAKRLSAITVRRIECLGAWDVDFVRSKIKSIFIVGPLPSLSLRLRTKIFPRQCYYFKSECKSNWSSEHQTKQQQRKNCETPVSDSALGARATIASTAPSINLDLNLNCFVNA